MTLKHSVAILVVCSNEILLKLQTHEDYDIVDIFGSFVSENEKSDEKAVAVLKEIGFSQSLSLKPHGHIRNIIHKPNENVRLLIDLYKLEINKRAVPSNATYKWFDQSITSDPRAQRIRRIIDLAFTTTQHNIYWEENQFGRWIDSETLHWRPEVT